MDCQHVQSAATCFLTYDYAETKDYLKAALSLISGLLVFSVTFGERMIGTRGVSGRARSLLAASWVGLLLAFVGAGLAISLLGLAAGLVVHGGATALGLNLAALSTGSWICMLAAGIIFVLSLALLVSAAITAMYNSEKPQSGQD